MRNHFVMILSQRFNADISIIAQNSWELLCGWNNDPHCTIPPLYHFVCSLAKGAANHETGASQTTTAGEYVQSCVHGPVFDVRDIDLEA